MPGPPKMKHPKNDKKKKENVLLLTKKIRPKKGENMVLLQCFCQPFTQDAHLGVPTEYASR